MLAVHVCKTGGGRNSGLGGCDSHSYSPRSVRDSIDFAGAEWARGALAFARTAFEHSTGDRRDECIRPQI